MTEKAIRKIMNRREFVTQTTTACSIFCFGGGSLFALFRSGQEAGTSPEKHKFLRDAAMSYDELFKFTVGRMLIPTIGAVAAKVGIDVVQEAIFEGFKKRLAARVKNMPKRGLADFTQNFKSQDPYNVNTWTKEILQDTDNVFEMRVSGCLWAKTFREADAADLGFKIVCSLDYVTAETFNPKIKLIRDKTLMQGHDCCNHKYIFQD
jgi:hypothetical protein